METIKLTNITSTTSKDSVVVNWLNADVHKPERNDEPVVYCTTNGKLGTFKTTRSPQHWYFLKDKYHVKWWCYQSDIIPHDNI